MLNFHASSKKAAFNAVYAGELSELRLEVKTLSIFFQLPPRELVPLPLYQESFSPQEGHQKYKPPWLREAFAKGSASAHAARLQCSVHSCGTYYGQQHPGD